MTKEELAAEAFSAGQDLDSRAAREEVCDAVADGLRSVGRLLWSTGALLGPDRVEGTTPFGFGSDATVGLATALQVGGELAAGAALLLRNDNLYGAAALVRQLVEVEYLTWAFAEDEAGAEAWLRSSKQERMSMWQPGRLRKRSNGRFGAGCYAIHCERGGHPTPESNHLLPGHSHRHQVDVSWCDLAGHAASVWDHGMAASDKHGNPVRDHEVASAVAPAIDRWRKTDLLPMVLAQVVSP